MRARMIGLLAGACLLGTASPALAQADMVTEKLADFKSASQQLKELYGKAKSIAEQIDAAVKKQQAAEVALEAALEGVDPKNQQDGKLVEKAYAEMEAARQSIAAAELEAHNRAAIATEGAAQQQ